MKKKYESYDYDDDLKKEGSRQTLRQYLLLVLCVVAFVTVVVGATMCQGAQHPLPSTASGAVINAAEAVTVAAFNGDADLERLHVNRQENIAAVDSIEMINDELNAQAQAEIVIDRQRAEIQEQEAQAKIDLLEAENRENQRHAEAMSNLRATTTAEDLVAQVTRVHLEALSAEIERDERQGQIMDGAGAIALLAIVCLGSVYMYQRVQVDSTNDASESAAEEPPETAENESIDQRLAWLQQFAEDSMINESEISDNSDNYRVSLDEISNNYRNNSNNYSEISDNSAEISPLKGLIDKYGLSSEQMRELGNSTQIPEWAYPYMYRMLDDKVKRVDICRVFTGNSGGARYTEVKNILNSRVVE